MEQQGGTGAFLSSFFRPGILREIAFFGRERRNNVVGTEGNNEEKGIFFVAFWYLFFRGEKNLFWLDRESAVKDLVQ